MANPTKKFSKTRTKNRHSQWKIKGVAVVECSHCGAMIKPHQMCPSCGYYNGREIKVVGTTV